MNTRPLLIALALAGAALGAAQAATPQAPQHPAASKTTAVKKAAAAPRHPARHAKAKARTSAMDRVHQRLALAREAEQRRWIATELQRGRLDRAQAASLWDAAADLAREQVILARRGHETVDEALALSHRQDLLDWAIRSGEIAYEPQALRTAG